LRVHNGGVGGGKKDTNTKKKKPSRQIFMKGTRVKKATGGGRQFRNTRSVCPPNERRGKKPNLRLQKNARRLTVSGEGGGRINWACAKGNGKKKGESQNVAPNLDRQKTKTERREKKRDDASDRAREPQVFLALRQ